MSESFTAIAADALFVVACPVCQGQVAALGSLCGRDACCPLCASLFHVPQPAAAVAAPLPTARHAAPVESSAEPASVAEDWDGVISQLAPVRQDPGPTPPEPPEAIEHNPFDLSGVAGGREDIAAAALPEPGDVLDASVVAEVVELTDPAPTPATPPRRAAPPQAAAGTLPVVGGTPLDPQASELAFSEPVRTIRHGDTVIEIRRLTPEERRGRRFRLNLLMVVMGVSILLATYMLLR